MTVIATRREAECVLGLIAAAPAFTTAGALAASLDVTQAGVKASLHAVNSRLASEAQRPQAFIENRPGYGWTITGRGDRIEGLYRDALRMIARDAGAVAADRKAETILPRRPAVQAAIWFGA
jgi:hypothetical protein